MVELVETTTTKETSKDVSFVVLTKYEAVASFAGSILNNIHKQGYNFLLELFMTFGKHPSKILQDIYSKKPYQIQEPEKAKIIFLGRDGNVDSNIESDKEMFSEIIDYLTDGVAYWKKHGYHTPMLGPFYKGEGKTYHRKFTKLGFTKNDAEKICFIELIKFPTVGMSSKFPKEFKEMVLSEENKDHLERIRRLIENEKAIILIPQGLVTFIKETNLFNLNHPNIFPHVHFSNAISNQEIERIKNGIKSFLG